jgi:hypothetical protein
MTTVRPALFLPLLVLVLGIHKSPAQAPLSNLVVAVGTTISGNGADWSYLLLSSQPPQLLVGKRFAVYAKPGRAGESGTFVQKGVMFQQSDPAAIDNLLRQSVVLNEDLLALNDALNLLFQTIPGISNSTLPQKIITAFQAAALRASTRDALGLLSGRHPGLAICSGQAFSEPITGVTTYEVREVSPATGAADEVVGRVTVAPGLVAPLPAPGPPFQVVSHDARDHLIIRLRWGTPPDLRRLSLLSFGYNVWRIPQGADGVPLYLAQPPTPGQLHTDPNFTLANSAPVMATKVFSADHLPLTGGADDPGDPTTTFFADSNSRAYGVPELLPNVPLPAGYMVPPFNDGDPFFYFITARDILGRDGLSSPAGPALACRQLRPAGPSAVKVVNTATATPNLSSLQVNWQQNTNLADAVGAYWVYRWDNPAMALSNDATPLSNRIAVVSQVAGTNLNFFLDNGPDAPTTPGPTTYWYTVRAVSQAACGDLLSPQSPPAWGVLRERTGPAGTSGGIVGSCGTPAVMLEGVNTLAIAPDQANRNYRLTCRRRDHGIAWVQFAVSNDTTVGTNEILGPLYFPPDGDLASYDYALPVANTGLPANDQIGVSCFVGTYNGKVSQPANWTFGNLLASTQLQEVVFLSGELLLTALSSTDPLLSAVGGQSVCVPASEVTPYPDGSVRLQFPGSFGQPMLVQVSSNGGWSDVGVATADAESFYWLNYPACAVGPVPLLRGCPLDLPEDGDCADLVAGAAGVVAPIHVRFLLQPRTREYRLYRSVNDGPLSLIAQGAANYDSQKAVIRTDDAIPPSAATLRYHAQLLDQHGHGGPLSHLARVRVALPEAPRPLLSEPHSAGNIGAPQVALNWYCPTAGVYRFQVLIQRADLPRHTNQTGFGSQKLARIATPKTNAQYLGLTGARSGVNAAVFDETFLTLPVGAQFGPGPQFTVTASLQPMIPYNISVGVADAAGHLAGPLSLVRTFTWKAPLDPVTVPWPARPPPPVVNFDDSLSFFGHLTDPDYPFPRVAAVLQYYGTEDGNAFRILDQQYPVGIRIGDLDNPQVLSPTSNIGTSNFFYYTLGSEASTSPVGDPHTLIFRDRVVSPTLSSRQGGTLLPIVVYRQQVTNDVFPRVSGTLTQVTPLLELLAYEVSQHPQQPATIYIDDLLVAGGVEFGPSDTGFQHPHHFLYLRDQQPVMRGATYRYYVVRLNDQREISEIVPAGAVTIPTGGAFLAPPGG